MEKMFSLVLIIGRFQQNQERQIVHPSFYFHTSTKFKKNRNSMAKQIFIGKLHGSTYFLTHGKRKRTKAHIKDY